MNGLFLLSLAIFSKFFCAAQCLCMSKLIWEHFSSVAQLSSTLRPPWTTARQASLSITNSQSPPKPMSIELVMPSNLKAFEKGPTKFWVSCHTIKNISWMCILCQAVSGDWEAIKVGKVLFSHYVVGRIHRWPQLPKAI